MPVIGSNAAAAALPRSRPISRASPSRFGRRLPLGKWRRRRAVKKAYIAVSDYAPGHEAADAFTNGFTQAGGEIVDSVAFPVKDPDFVPFLQRVKDAKPMLSRLRPSGKQATAIMKAYATSASRPPASSSSGPQDIVPDEELPNMGQSRSASSPPAPTRMRPAPGEPGLRRCLEARVWRQIRPGFMSVDGWDGMAAIYAAIAATKGRVPDKAMATLRGWKTNSPRGAIMIDPETRDIVQHIYMRRVEKEGEARQCRVRDARMTKDLWKDLTAEVTVQERPAARERWQRPPAAVSIAFHGLALAMVLYLDLGRALRDHGADGLRQSGAWRLRRWRAAMW